MIEFLAGALTATFLVAAVFFFKFWRKTHDRLFSHFAIAFVCFALNQVATTLVDFGSENGNFAYLLRIIGYVLILLAIADKNRQALAANGRKLSTRLSDTPKISGN